MVIAGTTIGLYDIIHEEDDNLRAVDNLGDVSQSSAFYKDRNPDRTQTPDFNRQLKERQKELQLQEKKLRDLRESQDLKLVYERMKPGQNVGKVIDSYR